MVTPADIASVTAVTGAGRAKTAQRADHLTSTCEWGNFQQGGLFITIAVYTDAAAAKAAITQAAGNAGAKALAGVGDQAIQEADGVTFLKGNTIGGVFSTGGKAAGVVAVATKIAGQL
jgi:hypothetical protein